MHSFILYVMKKSRSNIRNRIGSKWNRFICCCYIIISMFVFFQEQWFYNAFFENYDRILPSWVLDFCQCSAVTDFTVRNVYNVYIYLCVFSFGKRTPGCARRASECLILEPSEMIVVSGLTEIIDHGV